MPLQGKRVVITGGAGFIGTTLARRLVDENEIVALDNLHRDSLGGPPLEEHPNFTFEQADGSYLMRSPFTPAGLGGPTQLLPANAATFYQAAVGVFNAQGGCAVVGAAVCGALNSFNPAGVTTNFIADGASFPLAGLDLAPIAPIRETTTTTFELGYKGILQERFSVTADAWFSQIEDFVTPLTVSTPLLACGVGWKITL